MKLQSLFSPTAISLVLIAALSTDARVQAGTFTQPAGLPVATVPTAYLDTATGNLQLNPAGRFISSYIFNAGITNPTQSTVGPFVYMDSTASQSSKISTGSVTKSFPVGTLGANMTGWQSQLGQAIFSPLVSDGNNIASNRLFVSDFTFNIMSLSFHPVAVTSIDLRIAILTFPGSLRIILFICFLETNPSRPAVHYFVVLFL